MKFPLKDIEIFIADNVLEAAEKLIEANSIRQFQELERNLWVALIEDGDTYEIEAQISPSKVKAFTCDCATIKTAGMCRHVAAILLLLRQKINARAEKIKKAKEAPKKKTPNRITTATILDLVKPNELKAFVKKYASQDRTFALLLKAQFTHIVPGHEEKEHINKVLENTINSVKRPARGINTSGIKLIQKVVDTILLQSEEALAKKHYSEVFDSLNASILQLAPLAGLNKQDRTFPKLVIRTYTILGRLCKANIAPQLENEIWEFLLKECSKAVYYLCSFWSELLSLTLRLATTNPRQEVFSNLLDSMENERFVKNNTSVRSALLSAKMSLLNLQGNQAAIDFFLKYNMNDKEVLMNAIQLSVEKEDWSKVKQLATYGKDKEIADIDEHQLNVYLLEATVAKKEKRNTIKYASICFQSSYDFQFLNTLKQVAGKKWVQTRDALLQKLLAKPYSIENRNAIAKIYSDENLTKELLEFIDTSKSLDLLKLYDQQIRQSFPDQLPHTYKSLIYNYLNNYIGPKAATKVRQSIEHLIAQDEQKLARSLVRGIRLEYKERHALMEELGRF